MNKILGLQDSYLQRQFEMSGVELDRATNSSYMDMTRWGVRGGGWPSLSLSESHSREIVLPKREMESVLSCCYPDIPAELTLSEKVNSTPYLYQNMYLPFSVQILKYYITPVNDFTDLIVCQNIQRIPNTVFTIVTFVGKVKQRSLGKSITSKEIFYFTEVWHLIANSFRLHLKLICNNSDKKNSRPDVLQ